MTDQARLEFFSIFITANHILSKHGLIDGFGHISVRNPEDPDTFFMTGSTPPALMRGPSDIAELTIADAAPTSGSTAFTESPYSERFVHSQIYAMYPEVQSVIHSHSPAVVALENSGVALQPMWHMAGFLGNEVPVFDPRHIYDDTEKHNLLVNNPRLGGELAKLFGAQPGALGLSPKNTVVTQRGHGFTTWGLSIKQAVYRAFYAQENAKIQQSAETLAKLQGQSVSGPVFLNLTEQADCKEMNDAAIATVWPFWDAQVRADPLYHNDLTASIV